MTRNRIDHLIVLLIAGTSLFVSSCHRRQALENKLNIAVPALKNLDPIHAHSVTTGQIVSLAYESLYQYDPMKRPLEVIPLLAESLPQISKDRLTYTIKIKKNIRFAESDVFPNGQGRLVEAADFVYSWKRIADPSLASEGFWIFDSHIKGLNDWRTRRSKSEIPSSAPIEGFQSTDKHTLVIRLNHPYPQLIYQLASPYTSVVASEAVEKYGDDFTRHTVGTGPFQLKEWTPHQIHMDKNPTWHTQSPLVETVVINIIPEASTRWLHFLRGELDYIDLTKDLFESAIDRSKQLKPELVTKGMSLTKVTGFEFQYLGFNLLDPALGKNETLRTAIARAVDRDAFTQTFYDGRGLPAQGIIPPGLAGFQASIPQATFDLNQAKELLSKAGFPEGKGLPEFELITGNSTLDRQMGEFFQQQLAQIGVSIRVRQFTFSVLVERLSEKKAQLFLHGWSADYPDAENFLQMLYGPNANPGTNHTSYRNEKYDSLYRKATHLPPGNARTKAYQELNEFILRDMPLIPLVWPSDVYINQGWVENFKPSTTILNYAKYISVNLARMKDIRARTE